jgi:hypothetical protein
MCALLAEYKPAGVAAATVAWGFDLAVLLQVLPAAVDKSKTPKAA